MPISCKGYCKGGYVRSTGIYSCYSSTVMFTLLCLSYYVCWYVDTLSVSYTVCWYLCHWFLLHLFHLCICWYCVISQCVSDMYSCCWFHPNSFICHDASQCPLICTRSRHKTHILNLGFGTCNECMCTVTGNVIPPSLHGTVL